MSGGGEYPVGGSQRGWGRHDVALLARRRPEPGDLGRMSVMIGRTNKPIGNCRFGFWEEKNSAMRLRIFLIKLKITKHSFEVRPSL